MPKLDLPKFLASNLFESESRFFSKHLLQKIGLSPFGLYGTSHSLLHLLQVVLCIKGLPELLLPK
jgi:hypothetical protein